MTLAYRHLAPAWRLPDLPASLARGPKRAAATAAAPAARRRFQYQDMPKHRAVPLVQAGHRGQA